MPDIEIKRIDVLRGPSIWAHQPVLDAHIDIGPYEEKPSDSIEGFTDRLFEAMPSLITHRCSEGRRGGFLKRMREGTWMGHIIEHVALELQSLAGMEVSYGKTRSVGEDFPGEYNVVVEYLEARAGKMSIEVAVEGCEALACDEPYDFGPAIAEIQEIGQHRMLGPAMRDLLAAARRRGIPWITRDGKDALQLGYGKSAWKVADGKILGSGEKGQKVRGSAGEVRASRIKEGQPDEYYDEVVERLFPDGDKGRIPIVAVTGTKGQTTVARMISQILREAGHYLGMATSEGVYLGGTLTLAGDCSGPQAAEEVLENPDVEVAVLETGLEGILHSGLAFDVCDVGVVLNATPADTGREGLHSTTDVAQVESVVAESVRRSGFGVLNADDPLVVDMARYCDGALIYFSPDPTSSRLVEHFDKKGMGVTVADGWVVLREGKKETRVIALEDIPATRRNAPPFDVGNILAAVGAAWGAGVEAKVIARGIRG